MINNFIQKNTSRGYTLLFSVLVSSLVLAVGISILNIAKKEFLIATSTRDSSAALYAADSGLECAIYGQRNNAFAIDGENTDDLGCRVERSTVVFKNSDLPSPDMVALFTFHARFSKSEDEGGECAFIQVEKWERENNRIQTIIKSRGYNTGWNSTTNLCDRPSAKRVERALQYSTY
jgi:hypothetical protein